MTKSFKKGGGSAWDTSQGETHGKVMQEANLRNPHQGAQVAASEDAPQFIVESYIRQESRAQARSVEETVSQTTFVAD